MKICAFTIFTVRSSIKSSEPVSVQPHTRHVQSRPAKAGPELSQRQTCCLSAVFLKIAKKKRLNLITADWRKQDWFCVCVCVSVVQGCRWRPEHKEKLLNGGCERREGGGVLSSSSFIHPHWECACVRALSAPSLGHLCSIKYLITSCLHSRPH